MVTIEYELPEIGEGVTEAEILKWLVAVGDTIVENQPLVEVMTDKATVEIPADVSGVVQELRFKEGDVVPIGGVLIILDAGGGDAPPSKKKKKEQAPTSQKETVPTQSRAPEPTRSSASASSSAGPSVAASEPPPAVPVPVMSPVSEVGPRLAVAAPPPRGADGTPILAAPATRKLARELGVELACVPGSGQAGRVTPDDVTSFAQQQQQQRGPAPAARPAVPMVRPAPLAACAGTTRDVEVRPLRGLRRKIAEAMTRSKSTAAHFSYVDEVDVTELVSVRRQLKPISEERGVKLSYLPFIIKAVVKGLKAYPILNASLLDEQGEIHIKKYYNIGIAAATDSGLIVPVVKDVDRRSILELASEIQRVSMDAREGKTRMEDVQDGTFTITSAGNIGGLFATPIINHPEVAILGVHVIKKRPVVDDAGQIVVREMMYLSISLDHRVVDGAECSLFMNTVIGALQSPAALLIEGS